MEPGLDEIFREIGYGPCGISGCNKVKELNLDLTDKTKVYWPCDNCTSNPNRRSAPDNMTVISKEMFGITAKLFVMPYIPL